MEALPWAEQATLTRRLNNDASDAVIVMEGTLRAVARHVGMMPPAQRRGLRIALPDRHVQPFAFNGTSLDILVGREKAERRLHGL